MTQQICCAYGLNGKNMKEWKMVKKVALPLNKKHVAIVLLLLLSQTVFGQIESVSGFDYSILTSIGNYGWELGAIYPFVGIQAWEVLRLSAFGGVGGSIKNDWKGTATFDFGANFEVFPFGILLGVGYGYEYLLSDVSSDDRRSYPFMRFALGLGDDDAYMKLYYDHHFNNNGWKAGLLLGIIPSNFNNDDLTSMGMSNPFTGQASIGGDAENEATIAAAAYYYHRILAENQGAIVKDTAEARLVAEVSQRIINAAIKWATVNGRRGYMRNFQWEYTLMRNDEPNANCRPGGKILVYTGILPITKNADGLAAIIGHEVAHALLMHSLQRQEAEEWSFGSDKKHYARLPFSRATETEADKVGLTLMLIAGYDGSEAPAVWERMSALGSNVSEFESTHPSDARRMADLRKELPAAQKIAAKVNAGKPTTQFVEKRFSVGIGAITGLAYGFGTEVGGNLFIDINKYCNLNVSILTTGNTTYNMFEILAKFPFKLNEKFVWFPAVGIYDEDGRWQWSYGMGVDLHITDHLFLRGMASWHATPSGETYEKPYLMVPIKLGLGYGF
jgi:hypothetical protein